MAITYPEVTEVLIDGVTVAAGATAASAVFSFPDNALIVKAELYVTVAGWSSAPGASETAVVWTKAVPNPAASTDPYLIWGGGYQYKVAGVGRDKLMIPVGQLPKSLIVTWTNETTKNTAANAVTVVLKYQYLNNGV